jgi:hypothetical protein
LETTRPSSMARSPRAMPSSSARRRRCRTVTQATPAPAQP